MSWLGNPAKTERIKMFTDWTMEDPRYFYIRGVIYGVVLATMFWKVIVPCLCERFRKPNDKDQL
jgi:hypothetical protein